jgi:hypothetical protein
MTTTTTDMTTDKMTHPVFHDVIGVAGGHEGEVTLTHVRGRQDFRLDDVVVGSSWMAGMTTSGRVAVGCVKAVDLGEGFVIRQRGGQRSKLWREFWLLEAPPERLASSASGSPLADSDSDDEAPLALSRDGSPAVLLRQQPFRRTDSGLDYGLPGYPDCAWWANNWLPCLFVVPTPPATPRQVLKLLVDAMDCGDVPAEGPFREAWDRQMASCHAAASSPVGIAPASEAAMASLRQTAEALADMEANEIDGADTPESLPPLVRPPPLRLPTVRDHIGQGIRPGEFIKPDPHDARARQRRHILTELLTWLSDRICGSARLASHTDMTEADIRAAMSEGRGWPGGRLWLLLQKLDEGGIPLPGPPADTADRLRLAGSWAATFCERWLRGETLEVATETMYDLALGFVTEDQLSDGRTIADLWPEPADLDALREASPLPSESEEDEEEVMETPRLETTLRSMDQHLDEIGALVGQFMGTNTEIQFRVKMPGWAWTSLFLTVVGYFWLVAFLLSGVAPRRVGV